MAKMNMKELRSRIMEVLEYNPKTGLFRWKVRYNSMQKVGWFAGNLDCGYRRIKVFDVPYLAHRLAWLLMTGSFPVFDIDHADHDRSNNRFSNLSEATKSENNRNKKIQKWNKTGVTGVFFDKRFNRFTASIGVGNRRIYLGCFCSLDEAAEARREANVKYGFHNNHGAKTK